MRTYRILALSLLATTFVLSGCRKKNTEEKTDDTEMARGSYSAEKNLVTVVPLERTDRKSVV